jgi:hypothetical protein
MIRAIHEASLKAGPAKRATNHSFRDLSAGFAQGAK